MSESSTRVAYNGSNVINVETATSITGSSDDHSSSYSLKRFLAEPSHTMGYAPVQTRAEAEKRTLEELRKFETKFSSNSNAV
ncbi:hypothetical protein J3E69DRAFT_366970 [Trichoderma sp. SZMC 28015]